MAEVIKHPDHAAVWTAAARGEPADLANLLRRYEATVDWPACAFWRELMAVFPDARVLLSVRPADRWADSFDETIHKTLTPGHGPDGALVLPEPVRLLGQVVVKDRSFGPGYDSLGRAGRIAAYERHNTEVRDGVPPERLEYDVSEGWAPLCTFLGVEQPEEEFPRRNDRQDFQRFFGVR